MPGGWRLEMPEAEAMSEAWRFMSEAEAEAEWLWRLSQGGRGWEAGGRGLSLECLRPRPGGQRSG
jgi:hypothetical protein